MEKSKSNKPVKLNETLQMDNIKFEIEFTDAMANKLADKLIQKGSDKFINALSIKTVEKNKLEIEGTYSVKEIAKLTNKHHVTIQRHIKAGYLLASKPGKNFVITQSNLKNYLNGNF